jgi:PhnB protein
MGIGMTTQNVEAVSSITPYLYYEDLASALRWLADSFGFRERKEETKRSSSGSIVHSAMALPGGVVLMGAPGPGYKNPKRLGQTTQCLYVVVDDVAQHFEHAKAAGASIVSGLEDTPYGHRRYGADDLEGHRWYFAQKLKP